MMNKDIDDGESFPPLTPMGEAATPNDSAFVKDCLLTLDRLSPMGHIEPGAQRLTENNRWGLVFRVDFRIDGDLSADSLNRLVCWKDDNGKIATMFAIGQNIEPLSARA
jgi:hypothetical protein